MAEATSPTFAEALASAEAEHGQSVNDAIDEAQIQEQGTATVPPPEAPEPEAAPEVPEVPESEENLGETPEEPEVVEEATEEPRMVTVKVNGETFEVTEEEAINGYQRQADYTRGTQEIAEQRSQMEAEREQAQTALNVLQALENDPADTLRRLAENLDVDLDTLTQFVTEDGEDADPLEAKVEQLTQWHAEQQAAQEEAAIFAEIDTIKSNYDDPDLDPAELLTFAMEHKLGDLDKAYKSYAYDRLLEQVKSERDAAVKAADLKVVETKREAPPIAGGAHRNGSVSDKAAARPKSIAEAYAQSVEELGG